MYRRGKCFEQKLQRKMRHTFHGQYTFSANPTVLKIIKPNRRYEYIFSTFNVNQPTEYQLRNKQEQIPYCC
jgi:hypothetical protein